MKLPVNYNELSWQQRRSVRLAYIANQEGKCCHCACSLDEDPPKSISDKKINTSLFPVGFFNYPVHLHHDHKTGMTIGAVHNYCNAVLWQYHGQ